MKGKSLTNAHCVTSYGFKVSLQAHIESIHEGKKYPYDICDAKLTSKGHLQLFYKCEKDASQVRGS